MGLFRRLAAMLGLGGDDGGDGPADRSGGGRRGDRPPASESDGGPGTGDAHGEGGRDRENGDGAATGDTDGEGGRDRENGERAGTDDAHGDAGEVPEGETMGGEPGDRMADTSAAAERADFEAYVKELCDDFTDYWWEYDLDYSPASLARLDDLVDDTWDEERFQGVEADPEGDFDERAFAGVSRQLGAYYGEVLVRNLGGEWRKTELMGWAVHVDGDGEAVDEASAETASGGEPADESDAETAGGTDTDGQEAGGTSTEGQQGDGTNDGGDAVLTNAFHVARDCLTEPSKFAVSYDTVAERVGAAPIGDAAGGRRITFETPRADADPEHFREAAAELVDTHPEYDLDYSEASLSALDEIVRTEVFDGRVVVDDLDEAALAATVERLGSYLGEVLVRERGGEWGYSDERGTWGVALDAVDRDVEVFLMTMTTLHADGSFTEVTDNLDRATDRGVGVGPEGGDADAGASEELVEDEEVAGQCRERAEEFVAERAGYDLDYSVESLSRLDELASEELVDMVGALMEAEAESGDDESAADMLVGAAVLPYACYFGEVLRRSHEDDGAVWVDQDGRAVAVPTDDGVMTVDPLRASAAVAGGDASFRALYDELTADL